MVVEVITGPSRYVFTFSMGDRLSTCVHSRLDCGGFGLGEVARWSLGLSGCSGASLARGGWSVGEECLSGDVVRGAFLIADRGQVQVELFDGVGQDAPDKRPGGVLVIGGDDIPGGPGR